MRLANLLLLKCCSWEKTSTVMNDKCHENDVIFSNNDFIINIISTLLETFL